jgi:hypothetical protein
MLVISTVYLACISSFAISYQLNPVLRQSSRPICHNCALDRKVQSSSVKMTRSLHHMRMMEKDESQNTIKEDISTKDKLAKLGQSGLLAYGFLNFSYYSIATIIAWASLRDNFRTALLTMSIADRYKASLTRLGKLMAVVWAGSQVTKAFRISGSVFLAPYADDALTTFQRRLNISSRSLAFSILASGLLAMTFVVYGLMIAYTTFII